MSVNLDFIKSIIPTAIFVGKNPCSIDAWTVDSRVTKSGNIFVALSGSKTDGHFFVTDAFNGGAMGAMIEQSMQSVLQATIDTYKDTHLFIIVADVRSSLCALASAWRRKFSYPVIGVTGSSGKTTTKEMLGNMLRCKGDSFLLSEGNQNTLIGLSLNVLNMRDHHTVAIFEMGISKRGEMAKLAELALPTIAIITSIGHCHMEGLGSIVDIAVEKRDIFKYLSDVGIGIIDGDQPLLSTVSYSHPVIKFGKKMVNQVQARKIQHHQNTVRMQLKLYNERHLLTLKTANAARISNALAAASAAYVLKVSDDLICRGIQEYEEVRGRFKPCYVPNSQSVIVDDSYNANPESMKAALHAFEQMEGAGKKVAVLGDMLELGINTPFWHRQLGRFLRKVPSLDSVIFIGEHVKWAHKMVPFGLQTLQVASWQEAVPLLKQHINDNAVILIKASRGIGLRNLVDTFMMRDAS